MAAAASAAGQLAGGTSNGTGTIMFARLCPGARRVIHSDSDVVTGRQHPFTVDVWACLRCQARVAARWRPHRTRPELLDSRRFPGLRCPVGAGHWALLSLYSPGQPLRPQ
jgi:hypothetical protein